MKELSKLNCFKKVMEHRSAIMKYKQTYGSNTKKYCIALVGSTELLRKEGYPIMNFYNSLGVSKDEYSIARKRVNVSEEIPNYSDIMWSMSDRAIKIITNNRVSKEDRLYILSNRLIATPDILKYLSEKYSHKTKERRPYLDSVYNKINSIIEGKADEEDMGVLLVELITLSSALKEAVNHVNSKLSGGG